MWAKEQVFDLEPSFLTAAIFSSTAETGEVSIRKKGERKGERDVYHGCQIALARFLDCMCLALWASGLWLRYAAKFDPFLSLDCAPTPSTLAQSKERKGSNFAIWQPCEQGVKGRGRNRAAAEDSDFLRAALLGHLVDKIQSSPDPDIVIAGARVLTDNPECNSIDTNSA